MQFNIRKYVLRPLLILGLVLMVLLLLIFGYIYAKSQIDPPATPLVTIGKRTKIGPDSYVLGPNYLRKNEYGVWEMYIEGAPYERGLIYGELAKELIQYQEDVFVSQIKQLIPSPTWQRTLKWLIGYFNSELPNNIPLENQQEMYGISKSFSSAYDFISPKYVRILNYHAAHDIGHALNDYSLVGCTSFALQNSKTVDRNMIIGRNFDFFVSDSFAQQKLILFVNPTTGYKFASYSWAGFTGVVSGLNEMGLSVTINASKSDIPTRSRTPISLLTREILQYAATIEEAVAIAGKRNTFVSETLMIGSARDGKTVLIEKSPTKMGIYDSNLDALVCANHYQSDQFKSDKINLENLLESDSKYRFDRVQRLLADTRPFDVRMVADVLRDQHAANGDTLGMGNPRAVNQLNAHHSVVILPQQRMIYVSTHDFQLGPYTGYDLTQTFAQKKAQIVDTIPSDPLLFTDAYRNYLAFREVKNAVLGYLKLDRPLLLGSDQVRQFIAWNAESYLTYEFLGRYYLKKGHRSTAANYFSMALEKQVASKKTEEEIKTLRQKCLRP